jgi:cellulose synthase/poly-beta-1,6-N-acetylglucosamine synthase-like glycosyltransferase
MSLILFWTAIGSLIYVFAAFTAIIIVRGRFFPKPFIQEDITPSISIIIAAYNEEENIAAKIENSLTLDYPPDKLEIIIGSDGSTDRTAEIVQQFSDPRIHFFDLPRMGKNGVLNTIVPNATGEILVFSDANSIYAANAIRALARGFSDPHIGGVAGNQTYLPSEEVNCIKGQGERVYWNFDQTLKEYLSRAGNINSATGAMYAIRSSLFCPISKGTDDFIISTGIIAQGYRLIYAPDAISYEPVAASSSSEYKRKVRNIMLGLEAVLVRRQLLNPFKHGFYALQLFTHKVLRRFVFVPLLVLLITSLFLWNQGLLYQLTAIAQLAFYGLALLGFFIEKTKFGHSKIVSIPLFVTMVYTASLVATFNLIRGRRIHKWETQRQTSVSR